MGRAGKGKMQIGSWLTEDIYLKAKAQAALEKRTVGSLIDDAIQLYLSKVEERKVKHEGNDHTG